MMNKHELLKLIKYLFVGGTCATLDLVTFIYFAKILGYNYLWVSFYSFIFGTLLNYFLSIKFIFESKIKFSRKKEILLIFAISSLGLIYTQLLLILFIEILFIELIISKLLTMIIVFSWNYLTRRLYVF